MSKRSENGQMSLFGEEEFPVAEEKVVLKNGEVAAKREQPKAGTVSENVAETPKKPKVLPGYDHTKLFERLDRSEFRRGFHLGAKDRAYIAEKGLDVIQLHAEDFVAKRLAPAFPHNDGSQTPMRGHPVFRAQHATACCCRGCFEKWHHIPTGRPLTEKEQEYAVSVLMSWIRKELK